MPPNKDAKVDLETAVRLLREAFPDPDNRPFMPEGTSKAYRDLSEHTRDWIEGKSKAELEVIDRMARDYTAALAIGRFFKWSAIALVAVFATMWAAGEKVAALITYLRIGRLP